jgi:hypothetical protein
MEQVRWRRPFENDANDNGLRLITFDWSSEFDGDGLSRDANARADDDVSNENRKSIRRM